MCFSIDGFLLNYLLSLGWIPLGGKYRFLYLLGGVNLYLVKWWAQNCFLSLAKFLWVVLFVFLWVYFGGELIYPLNYWVFSYPIKPKNIKYIHLAYFHLSYRWSLGCPIQIRYWILWMNPRWQRLLWSVHNKNCISNNSM